MLVATKHFARQTRACHDEYLSLQKFCRDKIPFVATNLILFRQNIYRGKHTFDATKDVFCRDKHVCDKTFVAAKMILAAAHANDSWQALIEFEFVYKLLSLKYH